MIVIQHNIDVLDRSPRRLARGRRRRQAGHRPRPPAARAHRRPRPRVSSSSSCTPSNSTRRSHEDRGTHMLVIQRPTVEAIGEEDEQPSALRRRPARARLRPHDRQLAAPHAAVVDPRCGDHGRPLRRRPARVRHHPRRHRGRHRHHPQPQGHRRSPRRRRRLVVPPRRARAGRRSPAATSSAPADVEILNKDLHIATLNGKGRLAVDLTVEPWPRLPVERPRHREPHDRRDPDRRDLLAGAPGDVRGRADPRRAEHELRPPGPRHRDRRLDHAARGAGLGRRHAALAGRPGRQPERRAAGPRARRGRRRRPPARPTSTCRSRTSTCRSGPRNCLKRAQINTVGELLTKTEDDLLNITNFGQKSLDEVKQKLDERGLSLRGLEI